MPDFTPSETKVVNALADGKPHTADELMKRCLWDNLSGRGALHVLICQIRKKLKPHGQYIHCIEATETEPLSYIHLAQSAVSSSH